MACPDKIDSLVPGRTVTASCSAKPQLVGVSVPGRIVGYDVARAIAVIGMVIVNYHSIFLVGRSHHPRWFNELGFFLQGRAAATFVMLAGVGITLMSNKAILSDDAFLLKRIRQQLFRRSLVLFLVGLVFLNWWRADILHFYGIYLSAGALLLFISGRRLWLLVVGLLVAAAFFFTMFEADPTLAQVFLPANPILEFLDNLLISGHYAVLPWLSFLLAGMWLGRPEIISNRRLIRRIFYVSLLVLITTIVLEHSADILLAYLPDNEIESPIALMLLSMAFPASPLFAVSAMAGSLVVIVACIKLSSHILLVRPFNCLVAMGKMSLTIYISHIIIGLPVERFTRSKLGLEEYQLLTVVFTFFFCLVVFLGTNLWFRYFERGPLEWLLRRVSQSLLHPSH